MNQDRYNYLSLTRISDLANIPFRVHHLQRSLWNNGDYVLARVTRSGHFSLGIELQNGRMVRLLENDLIIGALGRRYATLELTGSWEEVLDDGIMHCLTGAGLLGKLTSKSSSLPDIYQLKYLGHVTRNDIPINMSDYVISYAPSSFNTPVVMLCGTSMSAGKTTTGRIVIHELTMAGKSVLGSKVTGAGRYRDILAYRDAGAMAVVDFVDAGLPSTVVSKAEYERALDHMLNMMGSYNADYGVIEIGASPLEPYNGDIAFERLKDQMVLSVLCSADPYAVSGLMKSFDFIPDFVGGIATNTLASIDLIQKLSGVSAINIFTKPGRNQLKQLLKQKLSL